MFKPLDRLASILMFTLALNVGGSLWAVLPSGVPPPKDGDDVAADAIMKAIAIVGVTGVVVAGFIASVVVFCMWMNRAAHNLRVFEPSATFQFTPGWCVGWWFIPFANLYRPFQAMREIWQHSDAESSSYEPAALLSLWWGLWIFSNFGDRVAMKTDNQAITILSAGLDIAAAIACIFVVRKVTAMQNDRARALDAGVRHVSATTPFAT